MKLLIKNANGSKVFFVVDNLRVHHVKWLPFGGLAERAQE
jgi:hypothetical protein